MIYILKQAVLSNLKFNHFLTKSLWLIPRAVQDELSIHGGAGERVEL